MMEQRRDEWVNEGSQQWMKFNANKIGYKVVKEAKRDLKKVKIKHEDMKTVK